MGTKTFTFTGPDGQQHSIDGPDTATPEQAFEMLQRALGGGGQVVPAQPRQEVGRGILAPMVEYSDGKVELGVPGVVKGAYDSVKSFMQGGYDPGAPEAVKTQQIENATGAALLGTPLAPTAGTALGQQAIKRAVTPSPMSEAARTAAEVGVTLPKHVARPGIRGSIERQFVGGARSIPIVGEPALRAEGRAVQQSIDAARRIADDLAPGATPYSAGADIVFDLRNWATKSSKEAMDEAYTAFGQQLPQGAMSPLTETRKAAGAILRQDQERATRVNNPVFDMVKEALARPQGLTFDGLKGLRTTIGAMKDDSMLPGAGTMKPALQQMYAALSKDMDAFVGRYGGERGKAAWKELNENAALVASDRELIQRLAGNDARSPEGIVDALLTKAGTKSTANQNELLRLLPKLSEETRNGLAAAVIHRLGRNQSNEFGLAQFVKNYKALSPNGRNMLFPSQTRAALDSLASTAELLNKAKAIDNFSGTGRTTLVGLGLAGSAISPAAALAALPQVIQAVVPGLATTWWLTRPAVIKEVSRLGLAMAKGAGSREGQAVMRLAIVNIAREIAAETGQDERMIARDLRAQLGVPDA